MAAKLRIIPLGGLGEIGKNMMLFEYGDNSLLLDAGLMFPENDMLGIDYIIPDFRYVLERKDKLRGIIITHGHREVKLRDARLLDRVTLKTINAGDKVNIGPFGVEFFHVCHSIPDGV